MKAHVWTAVEDSDCWVSSAPFVVDAAVSSSPLDLLVSLRPPVTGVVVQRWFAAPLHAHWMMAAPARVELASTSAHRPLCTFFRVYVPSVLAATFHFWLSPLFQNQPTSCVPWVGECAGTSID